MPAIELSVADRKAHRAEAHHLEPVVMIGAAGLTDAIIKATDAALTAHGLIKVRVLDGDREARAGMLADLTDRLSAAPIQHIGKLLVLWRAQPEKAEKAAPAAREGRGKGSRQVKLVNFTKAGSRPNITTVTVHGNQRVTAGGQIKRARPKAVSPKKRAG